MLSDNIVKKYLGGRYQYKGRVKDLDCYGLVWSIYKDVGIELPDLSVSDDRAWYRHGKPLDISALAEMFLEVQDQKFMDIVAFKMPNGVVNHAGVYLGDGKFIHATIRAGVVVCHLHDDVWKKRLAGVYRLKGTR